MKHLLIFEDYKSNHKGDKIIPNGKVYHKSNPGFRNDIEKIGLIPKRGDSYSLHSPDNREPLAIFAYTNDINWYDSTWDDDVWEIINPESFEWYIDNEVYSKDNECLAIVTYNKIPRSNIKLIYKGSGESC